MDNSNQNGTNLSDPRVEGLLQRLRDLLRSNRVYTNPPSGFRMDYDCIVVEDRPFDVDYANNHLYRADYSFSLTYITRAPFSTIPKSLLNFPMCSQGLAFTTDNLHHYTFTIYV